LIGFRAGGADKEENEKEIMAKVHGNEKVVMNWNDGSMIRFGNLRSHRVRLYPRLP
jgi:hypothetical protein